MKYLVSVADDFGFTPGINRGCIESVQLGMLRELSWMVQSPASDEAVRLCQELGIFSVGLHITLNNFMETGEPLRTSDYERLLAEAPEAQLQARVREELHIFEDSFGFAPSHINGHHSCHQHPKLSTVVGEYAAAHGCYVRRATTFSDGKSIGLNSGVEINQAFRDTGALLTDQVFEHIQASAEEARQGFIDDVVSMTDGQSAELFFHPAYVDEALRRYSSLTDDRERDRVLLTDPGFAQALKAQNAEILSFGELTTRSFQKESR